ncbi:DUF3253 domain-containing protein [Agrococcus sediminis]|uniref:DUF3253 domain-containing protein n=1 Tax=Agrococcus sediminis TaxID=2599924 RepID=A0A5M8QD63_9MICO|nr:DUF3253 domain-containing protein [Agrococcus sediminis]KAA6433118.1 DUF3253 domain-containing protein [Agrococcus sediminis]
MSADDAAMEAAILALLAERRDGATICPSDAARRVAGDDPAAWRPRMDDARAAAARLVARGEVVITQRGSEVDPELARGPIRIRRTPDAAPEHE